MWRAAGTLSHAGGARVDSGSLGLELLLAPLAVLALAPDSTVGAEEAPPQSLHLLLWRLCWQMLAPPQSLQLLLRRLCWQMLVPPQSLQ